MPGIVANSTPSYISSQSADVILSDVRPFKLKLEALHIINVFLDEFLYSLLNNSASLSTDKLRGSLLSLLPTSLGKEALLEAEVELRAYWERTANGRGPADQLDDDSETFHLSWTYELLRLKCEAYSTLNESDEDPSVEDRIQERFSQTVAVPPSPALLPPAALYLTAILEAMCEHILLNVGRVAVRDSSRVNANVNDLFTALCEDDSIYGLFRSMKVYEQIEILSRDLAKSRRSRSFTRSELSNTLTSQTGSIHQDSSLGKDAISFPRLCLSSEVSSSTTVPIMAGTTTPVSRISIEKAQSLKLLNNSPDNDNQNEVAHKKSESLMSEKDDGQRSLALTEDSVLQQEFDNLMRSSSTMRVSLTPDRLKTMEVYKQEKEKDMVRRRPAPIKDSGSSYSIHSSLRHVDSIVGHDDKLDSPHPSVTTFPRPRKGSTVTRAVIAAVRSRSQSISTSGSRRVSILLRNKSTAPSSYHHSPSNMARPAKLELNGLSPQTHNRQGNRESLDLGDVMGGSQSVKSPTRPSLLSRGSTPVSSSTRDLMDFLAQGPPHDSYSATPVDAKPKRTRIKKMASIFSIGDKSKSGATPPKSQSSPVIVYTTPRPPRPADLNKCSALASLANRPVPPRPPRPPTPLPDREISPPPSPVKTSAPVAPHSSVTDSSKGSNRPSSPTLASSRLSRDRKTSRQTSANASLDTSPTAYINGQVNGTTHPAPNDSLTDGTSQVVPSSSSPDAGLSTSAISHLYHLFQRATSAEECRLILHASLANHEISPQLLDAPEPTSSQPVASPEDVALEKYITGYLLGDEDPLREDSFRVTSNYLSTPGVFCDDGGYIDLTPPGLSSLSIDSSNNTLVGEMKA